MTPSLLISICVAVLCLTDVRRVHGLQWTPSPSGGDTVSACAGQHVTLPFNFSLDAAGGERVDNIRWFVHHDSGSDEMIGVLISGSFFARPAYSGRVTMTHSGNAVLVLSGLVAGDAGNYSAQVETEQGANIRKFEKTIRVEFIAPPETGDGRLHGTMARQAVYSAATDQLHVQLECGKVTGAGTPPVAVVWTTPSGTVVPSTGVANGSYLLLLDNPVEGGEYSCSLAPSPSPSLSCLPPNSPLLGNASVTVDGVEARLALMEGENARAKTVLAERIAHLEASNAQMKADNAQMNGTLSLVQAENAQMNGTLSLVQAENAQMNSTLVLLQHANDKLEQRMNRRVSFHAGLSTSKQFPAYHPVIPDNVLLNEGGAYSNTTGYFTAPYNGTYFFAASSGNTGPGRSADIDLMLNLQSDMTTLAYAIILDQDYYVTGSIQATVKLRAGQIVWVRSRANDNFYGGFHTTFSGFLISGSE